MKGAELDVATADRYATSGAATCRSLVDTETVGLLSTYLALQIRNGRLESCRSQVPGAHSVYGDPVFDALLARLTPAISRATGRELVPTYSFARVYYEGQTLERHSDRPACEHSVTLHISASADTDWPVWFHALDDRVVGVNLGPGDAAIYQGCVLDHWREPCPVAWYAQAFLHYVDRGGVNAAETFDRRPYLGMPSDSKLPVEDVAPYHSDPDHAGPVKAT